MPSALLSFCSDFLECAATNALGTDSDALGCSIDFKTYLLQIGQPSSLGDVMGMTDFMAHHRTFATNIAFLCHFFPQYSTITITDILF